MFLCDIKYCPNCGSKWDNGINENDICILLNRAFITSKKTCMRCKRTISIKQTEINIIKK